MEKKIFNRLANSYYTEKQFMQRELEFLYHTAIGRFFLEKIVTRPWASSLYTRKYYSEKSVKRIPKFTQEYGISMEDFPKREYSSFNDFFTRTILPDKRPIPTDKNLLIAPADSKMLCFNIDEGLSVSVKGTDYTLDMLLQDKALAQRYQNGSLLLFRLTVDDYHRYCFLDDGAVLSTKEISGKLHTVGPFSEGFPVFSENYRVVTELASSNFGNICAVEVGALLVGRITNYEKVEFTRGEEKGYFSYGGSTIILLFEEGKITPDNDIISHSREGVETKVCLGEAIGRRVRID